MVEVAQENDKKEAARIDAVEELTQAAETKKQKSPSPFGGFGFGLSGGQKS